MFLDLGECLINSIEVLLYDFVIVFVVVIKYCFNDFSFIIYYMDDYGVIWMKIICGIVFEDFVCVVWEDFLC